VTDRDYMQMCMAMSCRPADSQGLSWVMHGATWVAVCHEDIGLVVGVSVIKDLQDACRVEITLG
jgi:hypothetical protein